MQFRSFWPINRALSGATTPGQSEPGSDGNEGDTTHSPKFKNYWSLTMRSLLFFYPSAEMQPVYFTAPADWEGNERVLSIPQSSSITETSPSDCFVAYQDIRWSSLTPLKRCCQYSLQPQPTGPIINLNP